MEGTAWKLSMLGLSALAVGCGPGRASAPATPEGGSVQVAATEPPPPADADADAATPSAEPASQATAPEDPGPLPWTDPAAMAAEILTRCRGADPAAVVAVSTEVNRRHAIAAEQGRTACEVIFGQGTWRSDAVAAWSGRVGEVRVRHEEAWARFHELPDGSVAVVAMKQEGGRWRFDDLFNPPRARFESWGAPL